MSLGVQAQGTFFLKHLQYLLYLVSPKSLQDRSLKAAVYYIDPEQCSLSLLFEAQESYFLCTCLIQYCVTLKLEKEITGDLKVAIQKAI